MAVNDVLITGPARSGTTLTCELLNQVPNMVALDEPMSGKQFTAQPRPAWAIRQVLYRLGGPKASAPVVMRNVERFLTQSRRSLIESRTAVSKQVGGRVLGAKVADDQGDGRPRTKLARKGEIHIDKELTPDFMLAIKHPAVFTALLRQLVERFRAFALVRNPLWILGSWQTVPFVVRDGHATMAEALDPQLRRSLAAIDDRIDRQLHLLSWYFDQYHRYLPPSSILRYEEIVGSGGRALSVVNEDAAQLDAQLENRNRSGVYDADEVRALAARLLASDGAYWHFYGKDSVEEILASL